MGVDLLTKAPKIDGNPGSRSDLHGVRDGVRQGLRPAPQTC